MIHAYDEQNLTVLTHSRFKEQMALPAKLRSKTYPTLELIAQYYTAVQPLIERSPQFRSCIPAVRRIIMQNSLQGVGGFNTVLAAAEANVYDNENHVRVCNDIYGAEYVAESYRLIVRVEPNRTLLKLLLIVLAFSNSCSVVTYDRTVRYVALPLLYTRQLMEKQNIFATMLWKYLLYQYGHDGAVRRFDHMIKNFLDTLNRIKENSSTQHWDMVEVITEKTAQLDV